MSGPTFIASLSPAQGFSPITTPAFSPSAGELIVVKGATFSSGVLSTPIDSASALTFTQRVSASNINSFTSAIWTAPVVTAPGSITITLAASGGFRVWLTVERWLSVSLAASPATDQESGSTAPSGCTITTARAGSAVTWLLTNSASSVLPGGFVTTSATPVLENQQGAVVESVSFLYQAAPSAGVQHYGATSGPGTWSWTTLAMEIQAAAPPLSGLAMVGIV